MSNAQEFPVNMIYAATILRQKMNLSEQLYRLYTWILGDRVGNIILGRMYN